MAARDVLKNINLFVDGRGYAGQVQSVSPPVLSLKTEEFMAGGMAGPIELSMSMEKMESSFTLSAYDLDILALFGVAEGSQVNFTIRGVLESFDGTTKAVAHFMRGKVKKLDSGEQKPGEIGPLKVEMTVVYYRLEHTGRVIQEIDVENMVYMANGVDILAARRAALGI